MCNPNATGEHTTAEINAMVRGGKLRGHIPGVGPVMPGYVRSRLSYTAPVDRSRDVDFMMSLMRSDNRFADAFARYDSGGASRSRARDRAERMVMIRGVRMVAMTRVSRVICSLVLNKL
ncbi:hypothetical protein Tco_1537156 [Tanacetum coccineum]